MPSQAAQGADQPRSSLAATGGGGPGGSRWGQTYLHAGCSLSCADFSLLSILQASQLRLAATLAALLLAPFPASAAMDLSFAPSSVKESLEARDEAAEMKCKQMFDCE